MDDGNDKAAIRRPDIAALTPIRQVSLTDVSVVSHTAGPPTSAIEMLTGGTATLVVVTLDGSSGVVLGVSGVWASIPQFGELITATGRQPDGATYVSPVLFFASAGTPAMFVGPYPLPHAAVVSFGAPPFPKRGAFPTPKEELERAKRFVPPRSDPANEHPPTSPTPPTPADEEKNS